jgi:hypothetical protein
MEFLIRKNLYFCLTLSRSSLSKLGMIFVGHSNRKDVTMGEATNMYVLLCLSLLLFAMTNQLVRFELYYRLPSRYVM